MFPKYRHAQILDPSRNAAPSAITPSTRLREFILNVRSDWWTRRDPQVRNHAGPD